MRKILSASLLCSLSIMSLPAHAQEREINVLENGWLYWTGYYVEWKLSDKLQLDAEIDNRRFFDVNRLGIGVFEILGKRI